MNIPEGFTQNQLIAQLKNNYKELSKVTNKTVENQLVGK